MATTITVLYENVDDATFDLDYYMAKHMPLGVPSRGVMVQTYP